PEPGLRIQFVSDLHLEFEQNRLWLEENPLEVTGDILLIAGDTAYLDVPESGHDTYSQYAFWDWASEHYKQVIVCFGNHDFYGYYDLATMPEGYCKQIRHNVHAYYNKVISLGDVDIIVSTLWSFIEPFDAYQTEKGVSDFYRIMYNGHRLTADDFNAEHERCFDFIRKAVKESKAQTKIVLTHHVPTQQCTAKEFRGSTINGATNILSNQLGYISHGEFLRNGFKLGRMIESLMFSLKKFRYLPLSFTSQDSNPFRVRAVLNWMSVRCLSEKVLEKAFMFSFT
ncbi:MAG: metallophosphoesterase, partial [Bacteroidales bacterium]|nr:metallophosphoesterase [Bacteroidales bacterium]